ncbi:molecular chaperone [Vibrio sp. ZSDZ65]|uniref:Molecular chaperone n=1 Tax=Vibrio qingdaonensis TaxID=2829491 RepID=A0A9X3CNR3_9VIBR|nr:molecular chaperone [Vibrio qingdaonensis]MCW8346449.1 molecular chaperone [Vibrio qingdaonensis]
MFLRSLLLIVVSLLPTIELHAGVRPINTREVITTTKEHQVDIINDSAGEYLVQSWLEDSDGNTRNLPLVLTPPIFKLGANERGFVRILPIEGKLAKDRESLFFLSIQEIPKKSETDQNQLNIAVRTRIKIIVRPEQFDMTGLIDATNNLSWKVIEEEGKKYLQSTNNSPYYLSLGQLKVSNGSASKILDDRFKMTPPFGQQKYAVPNELHSKNITLEFGIINDYGGLSEIQTVNF